MSSDPFYCPPPFDPEHSLLAGGGLSTAVMQANLAAAQLALIQLSSGQRIVKASYTQGDGAKTIEYSQTNIAQLQGIIQLLQSQLGIVRRARRPIGFVYR